MNIWKVYYYTFTSGGSDLGANTYSGENANNTLIIFRILLCMPYTNNSNLIFSVSDIIVYTCAIQKARKLPSLFTLYLSHEKNSG